MWVDYEIYYNAFRNYYDFITKPYLQGKGSAHLMDFLAPYLDKVSERPYGTLQLIYDDRARYVIWLTPRAAKVVKALSGPYSYALLKAHFASIQDESQPTSDQ